MTEQTYFICDHCGDSTHEIDIEISGRGQVLCPDCYLQLQKASKEKGLGAPFISTPDKKDAAKKLLGAWQCECGPYGCQCFALLQIIALCAEGKPLFDAQHDLLEKLLERGAK
jgi:hypothetical protein